MATELVTSQGVNTVVRTWKQAAWDTLTKTTCYDLQIIDESFSDNQDTRFAPGADGTLSILPSRSRQGVKLPGGSLRCPCEPLALEILLAMLMHHNPAGGVYNLSDTSDDLPYVIQVKKSGVNTVQFGNCRLASGALSSSQANRDLMFEGNFIPALAALDATLQDYSSGKTPTLPIFQHEDLVLTVAGSEVKPVSLAFSIDHGLDPSVIRNSQTRLAIPKGRRAVTGVMELDWNAASKALYSDYKLAGDPFKLSAVWTMVIGSATYTLSITTPTSEATCLFTGGLPPSSADAQSQTITMPFMCGRTAATADDITISLATA